MTRVGRKPWWLLTIIILAALPVAAFPTLLALVPAGDEMAQTMAWFYLMYVPITAWLAWVCWPQRKAVTWILLVLLLLTHAAMWGLVLYPR